MPQLRTCWSRLSLLMDRRLTERGTEPSWPIMRRLGRSGQGTRLNWPGLLLLLDQCLRFHNGVFIRKGVKRRENQAASPGFCGYQAERRQGKTMIGLEIVEQAAFAPVRED